VAEHVTSDAPTDAPTDPRILRSRAKVLDAATALLVEAGPSAVTVDAVSERSGVAKSTMYRHWVSREELLIDVMRSNVPDIEPPAPELGFRDAISTLVRRLAEVLGSPEWAAIMPALMMLQLHMPDVAAISHDDLSEKFHILDEVLQRGIDEGVIPADIDHRLVARQLIGPIVFTVVSGERDGLGATAEYVTDRFLASYGA